MKKISNFLIIFSFIFTLIGCAQSTKDNWKKSSYDEYFSNFSIITTDNRLVIIGNNYHYIFDSDESLSSILLWDGRDGLRAEFNSEFELNSKNKIFGVFEIVCSCENYSDLKIKWLTDKGFIKIKIDSGLEIYKKVFKISGTRYRSSSTATINIKKLNKNYRVSVKTPFTTLGVIGRAALTPIAVSSDGIATIGTVALIIIAIPFIVVDSVIHPGK